jgi:hypothetical protein
LDDEAGPQTWLIDHKRLGYSLGRLKLKGEAKMFTSTRKTTTVLAALVLGLGVLGATPPSYADNNGSLASPAFPPDGAVKLGAGTQAPAESYTAYFPLNPSHSAGSVSTEWNDREYNSRSQDSHHL